MAYSLKITTKNSKMLLMKKMEVKMNITEDQIIEQIEKLLKFKLDKNKTRPADLIAWSNNVLNIFKLILPKDDKQIQSLETSLNKYLSSGRIHYGFDKDDLYSVFLGYLKALNSDLKKGFLTNLRINARSEVECDFLSQADRLLKEKLKDPAAMVIGAVLEDALRQLCKKHDISEGQKIEAMNSPLRKAGAYTLAVQKQITAWADIRNNADHARFDQYDIAEVKLMYQGVTDFVAKYLF